MACFLKFTKYSAVSRLPNYEFLVFKYLMAMFFSSLSLVSIVAETFLPFARFFSAVSGRFNMKIAKVFIFCLQK